MTTGSGFSFSAPGTCPSRQISALLARPRVGGSARCRRSRSVWMWRTSRSRNSGRRSCSCGDFEKLAALLQLVLALLRASRFTLSRARLPDGRAKMRILRAVDRARGCIPLRALLGVWCIDPGAANTSISVSPVVASSALPAVRTCATIAPDPSMPKWSFLHSRVPRPPCFTAAHSPSPTIESSVLSTIRWSGSSDGTRWNLTLRC